MSATKQATVPSASRPIQVGYAPSPHPLVIELSGLVTALLADWLDRVEQPVPAG